ncbi:LysR family transcriptional regulator [Mesosutterella sp. AGMB02718]|uniref:LysR family transcriptional regulator n=1 Tax=Mesosutterella faecium TaxID=2925194 RepID=A0ABT7IJ88_9BURK|nr:LysR family transcriptional regulator [Mesosutterella sp. AGMB02718]MDL2058435.1 LysR family transcriptional regulator [Mesosutterella sp. AGMB02718]
MSKADDLTCWRYFAAFAKAGTLTAAANALQVEVSSISRAISGLEKALGCALIRHSSRPQTLTEAGQTALKRITPILRAHESLKQTLMDDKKTLSGNIRLSSAPGFASRQLIPLLQEFKKLYSAITVEILTGFKESDVQKGLCDVATLTGVPQLPGLCFMSRGRNVYLPVASPRYIEQHGMPLEPRQLKNHAGLVYNGPVRPETRALQRGERTEPVIFSTCTRSTDILAIRTALLDGLGVAVDMPLVQIYQDLNKGTLVPILPGWFRPPLECFIVTSRSAWHLKRIRIFLEWYATIMQKQFAFYESQVEGIVALPKDSGRWDKKELYRT